MLPPTMFGHVTEDPAQALFGPVHYPAVKAMLSRAMGPVPGQTQRGHKSQGGRPQNAPVSSSLRGTPGFKTSLGIP